MAEWGVPHKYWAMPEVDTPDKVTTNQGDRYNDGKAPLSMVLEARRALTGCAEVLAYGAKKYARSNWRRGLPTNEIVDSLTRHLIAYMGGELNDPETGLPHVNCIMCNALFLAEMQAIKVEKENIGE